MSCKHSHRERSVELADVFRMHAETYRRQHQLIPEQHKVINAIMNCRTSILGGHVEQCDACGEEHVSYNSCRNRHCPKCQSLRTLKWLESRKKELLPVQYFHVVFTLPHELNNLIQHNKVLLHKLLFQAAWETIKTFGKDRKRLDGLMGMISILHTWGQNLSLHNHVHCIVPGGALTASGKWRSSKKGFLFPVKAMMKVYRGIYVSKLRALYDTKQLKLPDDKSWSKQHFGKLLNDLMQKGWIVYAKKPFAGPEKLLDYLGRYTHKIAISNNRILGCDKDAVTFKWRDYSDESKEKIMRLLPQEFIRRFLQHVVPKGFMRIRFFGFLANACKAKNITALKKQLSYDDNDQIEKDTQAIMLKLTGVDIALCQACKKGRMRVIKTLPSKFSNTVFDTS
jgi:hypothetical protein